MRFIQSLGCKDYEIDIFIGKIAAVLVIVRNFFWVWRLIAEKKLFFSAVFFVLFIFIPFLYLFFLKTYNLKLTKMTFRIWFYSILLLCLSITDKFLDDFSGFWKVIFPVAFVTVCMLVGLKGVVRIKEPNKLTKDKHIKIPELHRNLFSLVNSVDIIIGYISIFILMVLTGKYFHDFVLFNWPSFEKYRILLFYVGIAIGYYPSVILGAAISCIFIFLVNLIYKYSAKLQQP